MNRIAVLLVASLTASFATHALAQTTAFTYQGELKQNGTSVSGTFDLRFRVYSTLTGGVSFLPETCVNNVAVVDGRFNATVDVPAAFTADAQRYIEVLVRPDTGLDCTVSTGFTTLAPRQQITAAPRANRANVATSLRPSDGSSNQILVVSAASASSQATTFPEAPLKVLTTSTGSSPGEGIRIQGTNADITNISYLSFNNVNGVRKGYVGDGSSGDDSIFLDSDAGGIVLNTPAGRVVNVTATGRVGIGTTTPQQTLDVNGSIRVAPTLRWKSVHPSAFQPQYFDSSSFGTQGGLQIIDDFGTANSGTVGDQDSTGNPGLYFAPLEVPDGATLVNVCLDARDSHSSRDISVSFGKINLLTGVVTEIATTFTSGSSNAIQHACNGGVSELIDNEHNVYFLRARMSTSGSQIHWLLAARVQYSVTSPLP